MRIKKRTPKWSLLVVTWAILILPAGASEPADGLTAFSGKFEGKDDFGALRHEIASRASTSVANALRQKLASPGSREFSVRLADALSIVTAGVPRKQWEKKLVSELSREFMKRLEQSHEEAGWPTFHYSVEANMEIKLSPDGKLVEAPVKPSLTLVSHAFPEAPAAIEDSAEVEPLRLSFKIRAVKASPGNVRWEEKKSNTIAFEPRYVIEFAFVIGETKTGVSLEGGGNTGVSGNTQTIKLLPTPNGSAE